MTALIKIDPVKFAECWLEVEEVNGVGRGDEVQLIGMEQPAQDASSFLNLVEDALVWPSLMPRPEMVLYADEDSDGSGGCFALRPRATPENIDHVGIAVNVSTFWSEFDNWIDRDWCDQDITAFHGKQLLRNMADQVECLIPAYRKLFGEPRECEFNLRIDYSREDFSTKDELRAYLVTGLHSVMTKLRFGDWDGRIPFDRLQPEVASYTTTWPEDGLA